MHHVTVVQHGMLIGLRFSVLPVRYNKWKISFYYVWIHSKSGHAANAAGMNRTPSLPCVICNVIYVISNGSSTEKVCSFCNPAVAIVLKYLELCKSLGYNILQHGDSNDLSHSHIILWAGWRNVYFFPKLNLSSTGKQTWRVPICPVHGSSIDPVESGNIWKHHENKFLSVERMMNFELSGAV